jgi:hypothetical protein
MNAFKNHICFMPLKVVPTSLGISGHTSAPQSNPGNIKFKVLELLEVKVLETFSGKGKSLWRVILLRSPRSAPCSNILSLLLCPHLLNFSQSPLLNVFLPFSRCAIVMLQSLSTALLQLV